MPGCPIRGGAGATALSRLVYGTDPALSVPALDLASLGELPLILLVGLVAGTLAAGFNRSLARISTLLTDLAVGASAALGVSAAVVQPFVLLPRQTGLEAAHAALTGIPRWLLVCDGPEPALDDDGGARKGKCHRDLDRLGKPLARNRPSVLGSASPGRRAFGIIRAPYPLLVPPRP
jgi:hypothetical protein